MCVLDFWIAARDHVSCHSPRATRQAEFSSPTAGLAGLRQYPGSMRIADAFRDAGTRPGLTDRDFLLTCSCGTEQRLDEMAIDLCGEITLYDCVRCTGSMVGVLADNPADELWAPSPMTRRQEAGGHRLNGYVVGSKVDVAIRPPGEDRDLALIPATPNFFVQYRYV